MVYNYWAFWLICVMFFLAHLCHVLFGSSVSSVSCSFWLICVMFFLAHLCHVLFFRLYICGPVRKQEAVW